MILSGGDGQGHLLGGRGWGLVELGHGFLGEVAAFGHPYVFADATFAKGRARGRVVCLAWLASFGLLGRRSAER